MEDYKTHSFSCFLSTLRAGSPECMNTVGKLKRFLIPLLGNDNEAHKVTMYLVKTVGLVKTIIIQQKT